MAVTPIAIALQLIPSVGGLLKDVLPLVGDKKKRLQLATGLAESHENQLVALREFADRILESGEPMTEERKLVVLFLLDQGISNADALGDFLRGHDDAG